MPRKSVAPKSPAATVLATLSAWRFEDLPAHTSKYCFIWTGHGQIYLGVADQRAVLTLLAKGRRGLGLGPGQQAHLDQLIQRAADAVLDGRVLAPDGR